MKDAAVLARVALASNVVGTLALVSMVRARKALTEGPLMRAHDAGEGGTVSLAGLLEAHPIASFVLPLSLLVAVVACLAAIVVGSIALRKAGAGSASLYTLVWSVALFVLLVATLVL
jgi:hypothetical protein